MDDLLFMGTLAPRTVLFVGKEVSYGNHFSGVLLCSAQG